MKILFDPSSVAATNYHFIDGKKVTGNSAFLDVLRPSDGTIHGQIPQADAAIIDQAVTSAKAAFTHWKALKPRERGRLMRRWADLIDLNAQQLAQLETVVSSRPFEEALTIDVKTASEYLRFYSEYCDKIEGEVTASGDDALSLVLREPYGVVAVITPWNFPMILSAWKIAPAIAAGNCVVLKPSELTPYSMTRMAELAIEAGIPAGVVNVVHGAGTQTGPLLSTHPAVDHVSFTGSTRVGGQIMQDVGASRIKPLALELGGKSPVLVFDDAEDLDIVADHITWGITRNAGQLCYAGSRLVVQSTIADRLLEKIVARMAALVSGPAWCAGVEVPPMISKSQAERVDAIVNATLAAGAHRLTGSGIICRDGAYYYSPTILTGIQNHMSGFLQEIFGPVLIVQVFDNDGEGIEQAQHPDYGLTASVFSANNRRALQAAKALNAGNVWINRWGRTADMMTSPFGGFGQSGFGKEAGRQGIENFTRQKSLWIDIGTEVVLGHQVAADGSKIR